MDYLDPKKKRAHVYRLYIGYFMLTVLVGIATLLLAYIANGYYIDDGKVIQNGLIYVDSKPSGANVYLNGEQQRGTTDSRLVVPAGTYDIGINKPGYRNWTRELKLEGGSLRRITYPRLVPEQLETNSALSFRANPQFISQSIDKRWLLASFSSNPLELALVDLDPASPTSTPLQIPEDIVDEPEEGVVEVVEWAQDNRFVLVKHTVDKKITYILIDRENPDESINLNERFNDTKRVFDIELQDRRNNQFTVYNRSQKSIFNASLNDGVNSVAVLTKVEDYTVFSQDWILYITEGEEDDGLVEARFQRGDKNILLKELVEADEYLLELARLGNAPIMGIASTEEDRAVVYNDPENYLQQSEEARIPVATTVLRVKDPIDMHISSDSSVIMAYGPENFASHEFEADRSYNFMTDLKLDSDQEIRWLDGQHFTFSADGMQYMMDFDGSNMYDLVSAVVPIGSFFADDVAEMFTVTKAVKASGDDPATPARLNRTFLLNPEDR